jgi:hypothetical protein
VVPTLESVVTWVLGLAGFAESYSAAIALAGFAA